MYTNFANCKRNTNNNNNTTNNMENKEKFCEWMRDKIKNIYFTNNEMMLNAFNKIEK